VSGRTPSDLMASAASSDCMNRGKASMPGISTISPTWLVLAGSVKSRPVMPKGPKTSSRLGELSQRCTSSTSWKARIVATISPGSPGSAHLRVRRLYEDAIGYRSVTKSDCMATALGNLAARADRPARPGPDGFPGKALQSAGRTAGRATSAGSAVIATPGRHARASR
jgi:hypothetical protein